MAIFSELKIADFPKLCGASLKLFFLIIPKRKLGWDPQKSQPMKKTLFFYIVFR